MKLFPDVFFLRFMREIAICSLFSEMGRKKLVIFNSRTLATSRIGDVTPLSFSYCLSEIVEMKCQDNISLLGSQGYKL